ncbi:MAG: hypothetical protein ABH952_09145, partial [Candidatus Omnitrophota bacterium]
METTFDDFGNEVIRVLAWKVFDAAGDHEVTVEAADTAGNLATKTVAFTIKGPGDDHPDDNESTSSAEAGDITTSASAQIAVLKRGFFIPAGELLNSLQEPFEYIYPDFSASIVDKYPILIIPTAGLCGMDNSEFFKAKLQEYVQKGGRLICFTQQYGYEFGALPVTMIDSENVVNGYGWGQDQNCYFNACYINQDHQILSGQADSILTDYVDGYFTKWPDGTSLILSRTKNGMPTLLMYDVGQGKVLATTSYLDWGFKHGQFSDDDRLLMRDMISWLKEAEVLPEYKHGDVVDYNLSIVNNSEDRKDAYAVNIIVKNPDKTAIFSETYDLSSVLLPGESQLLPFSYNIGNTSISGGIWEICYALLDEQNSVIQTDVCGERFVISITKFYEYSPEKLQMWVVSSGEKVSAGSEVAFSIFLKNNTDTEVRGNIGIGAHEARAEGGRWWVYLDDVNSIVIPAQTQIEIPYNTIINRSSSFYFGLFAEDRPTNTWFLRGAMRWVEKGVWVVQPVSDIKLQTDKKTYKREEDVNISVNMSNYCGFDYSFILTLFVADKSGNKVWEQSENIDLGVSESLTKTYILSLSGITEPGIYLLKAEGIFHDTRTVGAGETYFELVQPEIKISQNIPAVIQNSFPVSFDVINVGIVDTELTQLTMNIISPQGTIVYEDIQEFSILNGETKILDFPVSLPSLVFGRYVLRYALNYVGEELVKGAEYFDNTYTIDVNFNKEFYRIRDNLQATVKVTNTGRVKQELNLVSGISEFGVLETRTINLEPTESIEIDQTVIIPENTSAGTYDFVAGLESGTANLSKNFNVVIPESRLKTGIDSANFVAGLGLEFWVENSGGVDTAYTGAVSLKDSFGVEVYSADIS